MEFDALFLGVMNFFRSCRALRPRPAIDAVHFLGAQPEADPHRIHGGVAGADHGDAPAERKRRVVVREFLRPHQVAAGQQFVGGKHAIERIARDTEHRRIAGAGADEDGIEAELIAHLLDGEQAADQRIALELDAELAQILDFRVDHLVGQAEIGDAVFQHAAGLMECLVDRHLASGLGHVGRTRHAGRPGTDDPDLESVRLDIAERCSTVP